MGEKAYAKGMTRREYMREYYRKNRDKIRSAQRDYYALKGSAIRERANSNRETLGLLCRRCNPILGLAKESTATLSAAIKYLNERGTACKVAAQ